MINNDNDEYHKRNPGKINNTFRPSALQRLMNNKNNKYVDTGMVYEENHNHRYINNNLRNHPQKCISSKIVTGTIISKPIKLIQFIQRSNVQKQVITNH